MRVVKPSATIVSPIDGEAILRRIESAGRTCYKSESRTNTESAVKFVRMIVHTVKHHSVIEHESVSVRFICDRGVSHEIVRHRIASYSQESTRYCNYGKAKFGNELTFIKPPNMNKAQQMLWQEAMETAERIYMDMLNALVTPQIARSVLPNSLKTELVMTANLREWRHFFTMRCSRYAHPQIKELAIPLLHTFQEMIPVIFEDLEY